MDHSSALFQRAFAAHQEGRFGDAEAGYRHVLSQAPEHPSALHLLGIIEFDHKNYAEAVPLVRKSLALVPNDVQWLLNYALIMDSLGDYRESVAAYRKVLSINPQHSNALIGLGNGCYELGHVTEALDAYSKIVKAEPQNIFGKLRYNNALAKAGGIYGDSGTAAGMRTGECVLGPVAYVYETEKNETMLPAGEIDGIAEISMLVDSLYRMGYRQCAGWHAIKAFNMMKAGATGEAPARLLRAWQAPNREAMVARMLVTLVVHTGAYANPVGSYEEALYQWAVYDPANPEPLVRLGILKLLEAAQNNRRPSRFILDLLDRAHEMMQNDRSAALQALITNNWSNDLVVPYDGAKLHVYPSIENVTTYCLLEQGDWFERDMHLFRSLVRPGDRVLDLGANVGVYTISAAQRVGPQGRVVAVEPAASTYALLKKSAEAFATITAVNAAVGDRRGRGSLEGDQGGPELNRIVTGPGAGGDVEITTVDTLAEQLGIDGFDIIKIDVEGAEFRMLQGAQTIIGKRAPLILYEFCEAGIELADAFEELGYDSYTYCAPRNVLIKYHKGDELDMFQLNMFAARPESLHRFKGIVTIEDRG